MEPAIARGPTATVRLGGGGGGEPRCPGGGCRSVAARRALHAALFLAVAVAFAGAVYRARHRPRDLAFVFVAYYLLALLACCVGKLGLLRRRDRAAGSAGAGAGDDAAVAEMRRVRLAVWAVTVALANTFAWRVTEEMPVLALKLAVWGITLVALALAYYLIFRRNAGELGRGQSDADAGRRPTEV